MQTDEVKWHGTLANGQKYLQNKMKHTGYIRDINSCVCLLVNDMKWWIVPMSIADERTTPLIGPFDTEEQACITLRLMASAGPAP